MLVEAGVASRTARVIEWMERHGPSVVVGLRFRLPIRLSLPETLCPDTIGDVSAVGGGIGHGDLVDRKLSTVDCRCPPLKEPTQVETDV